MLLLASALSLALVLAPPPRASENSQLSSRRTTTPRCCAGGLGGTAWTLNLDVGVERGTWMPPTWGSSGTRALATVDVNFEPDGRLTLQKTGPWDHLTVQWATEEDGITIGRYAVDGERASIYLEHEGLERKDVILEPGRLYATAGAWGNLLGRRGNLSIKQRKFGWMPFLPSLNDASFLVGTFTTAAAERTSSSDAAPQGQGTWP